MSDIDLNYSISLEIGDYIECSYYRVRGKIVRFFEKNDTNYIEMELPNGEKVQTYMGIVGHYPKLLLKGCEEQKLINEMLDLGEIK